jgi:ubiquinone/menaquinone biosynthesis C-methylase UbiE
VFRYCPKTLDKGQVKILEVGCGTGPNIWFLAREGFQAYGIEGSESAIAYANQRLEKDGLTATLVVGDFTELPFPQNYFDLIFDRGSIVCCDHYAAKKAIDSIFFCLKPGGFFFFNPYSDLHSSRSSGTTDSYGITTGITEGTMVDVGQICFYSRDQVEAALGDFDIVSLEHLQISDISMPSHMVHAEWRAVAQKLGFEGVDAMHSS